GGIFYFLDARYKPHVELTWDMKLWWVHNEALLSILYGYYYSLKDSSVEGEPFLRWFHKVDGWAWEHFPDKKNREWFGYLNRRGEPTHYLKGGKWKTCFHLPRYLLKSIELMKNIKNLD
ncbi:MAG TPA: AGE family epimerase/isomerase, partial [Patescibacteria group bacterium]|nr:AGE family epimerase/isomerase [Patescibacteria group bacterium]